MPTRRVPSTPARLAPGQASPWGVVRPPEAAPIAKGRLAAIVRPAAAETVGAAVERAVGDDRQMPAGPAAARAAPTAGAPVGPSGPLAGSAGRNGRLVWAFVVCLALVP
jgi:hypothetical protein